MRATTKLLVQDSHEPIGSVKGSCDDQFLDAYPALYTEELSPHYDHFAQPQRFHHSTSRETERAILSDFDSVKCYLDKGFGIDSPAIRKFLHDHRAHKGVQIFSEALRQNDFALVREYAHNDQPTLIFSKFAAPYNKDLCFEGLLLEHIEVPKLVALLFPSNARPVNLLAQTQGFESLRSVALFPENFSTQKVLNEHDPVYYFINKFVLRFKNRTRPFLASGRVTGGCFEDLPKIDDEALLLLASAWVSMHEHFHTQGSLPIPKSLPQKSSRSSAAVEELRVDLLTILHSRNILAPRLGVFGSLVGQFVLAERLLRYPIDAHPNVDYDSRSSVMLAHMLKAQGAVSWETGKFEINASIIFLALQKVLDQIEMLELSIKNQPSEIQKRALEKFVTENTATDSTGKFQNISIFEGTP